MNRFNAVAIAVALLVTAHAPSTSAAKSLYRLEKVDGAVYRFVAGHYRSLVVVSAKSIVLTDPIDRAAATWLQAELARRFRQPVRYVVYSHSHTDHVYGGDVFSDPGIVFVAHRMTREALQRTKAKTRLPDLVFDTKLTLHVDGVAITLRYHGPNNGRGSVSMHIQPSNTLFVVDWIVLGRMPYMSLEGYDLAGCIASTREVLGLDFTRFMGGHGEMGSKADVRRYLAYIEALHDGVLDGIRAGKSLKRIQKELTLSAFSDLPMYRQWRTLNIAGAYRQLVDEAYVLRRPDVSKPKPDER